MALMIWQEVELEAINTDEVPLVLLLARRSPPAMRPGL